MSEVEFVPAPPAARPATPSDAPPSVGQTGWRARRLGPRSLTARISTGIAALLVLLVTAVGVTTYFALKPFLYDRLDQQLGPIATGNAHNLDGCIEHTGALVGCQISTVPGSYQAPETEWIVVVRANGLEIGGPGDTKAVKYLHLSKADRSSIAANPGASVTVQTTSGLQLRVTGRSLDSVQGVVVVSGLSTDDTRRTLGRLLAIELIIGVGAVLVALFATFYGVRFGLRRLRNVTTTAQEVAAEVSPTGAGLDRRVEVESAEKDTEVGQLVDSMNTLLSAVQTQFAARLQSEARLRQFLADASHELRTPLTSIRGYAELARMQKAAGANAEDNLARIESEGTRMSRLVEDLLLLARGERRADTEPVRELVDVAELVEDAASDTRAAYPEREVRVETVRDLHVIGDRDQLLRAVRNLVTNAAAHTAADRPIMVRGTASGHDAVIEVIDGGPGLPAEDAAHVFERFWRADKARTRARGGTGLGMSIVHAIITAHGGSVRFDSSVEGGSTVTIWLPGA